MQQYVNGSTLTYELNNIVVAMKKWSVANKEL